MDQENSLPMHLLIDLQACQSLVHGKRGIGIYAKSLVSALIRQAGGRRISFLINGDMQESAIELRRELLANVDPQDIHVWNAPLPRNTRDEGNAWRIEASQVVRDAVIASIAPDCFLLVSSFEGWVDDCICSLPSADSGVATAAVVYDLIPYTYPDIYLREPRLRNWYLSVLRSLSKADVLLAISDSSRREVVDALEYAPDRALNISAAVDERYAPMVMPEHAGRELRTKLKLNKPFVMYTGGIDHRKNIDLLIEAFAMTGGFATSHQLAIVCSVQSEESERLYALARRVGLASDALVLTGFVPDEDLLALYRLCELFVFPSWHEGFGLPVLEAMSVGAPVIASKTSSLPEVIGPDGEGFDPRDKHSIADTIIRVLSDDELRGRLASNGLARSKEFSWERTATQAWKGIEMAVGARRAAASPVDQAVTRRGKPKLAYLSPLPPQQSGIADFSAELLPELMAHYDIELIVDNADRATHLDGLVLPVRDVHWFLANAKHFDRVLYHFGNSEFHAHMFDVLAKVGGTVALHDFYLGNLHHWMQDTGRSPGVWQRALYEGYGYHALKMLGETVDRNVTAFKFPCNWSVVAGADGVIVHSAHSRELANEWYGNDQTKRFAQIPHLRKVQNEVDRAGARRALGLDDRQLVVATFGMLSANKCNESLLEAWLSSFSDRADCKLVFVGRAADSAWEKMLHERVKAAGVRNVVITGFADKETYRRWLASADIAVQLRRQSRGEASGAVLDCLAWGLPTIVNAHGSLAELPSNAAITLEDEFRVEDLAASIGKLIDSKAARSALAQAGRDYLERLHDPAHVAKQYSLAIDAFHEHSSRRILQRAVDRLSAIHSTVDPTNVDRNAVALGLSSLLGPAAPCRQLLLDVSELVRKDAGSGIQRVVRSILSELLMQGQNSWRIEPVYANADGVYRYARRFTCTFLGCPETTLGDDPIDVSHGDVFVALDLAPVDVLAASELFSSLKTKGVEIVFVLYDMLPLAHPEWFPPNATEIFGPWYRTVAAAADRIVAISRSVADEFANWLPSTARQRPLELSWFHLGGDVHASMPSRGMSVEEEEQLRRLRQKENVVLMVGTIEPRKGHGQALEAFEKLRARNVDAQLVIVGKQGWCVEQLVERLGHQVVASGCVTWFSTASDELLDHLYDLASLLLVASRGEGFGLPIIEAAMRGITVLARDLPVFREVGGDGILYFAGESADDLAQSIERSLAAVRHGTISSQSGVTVNSWATSAKQFLDAVTGKSSHKTWSPG
ncbi:glycosyltransferase [Dyella caseinilytica]|uniref:Glycosyltransferase n=1 Tax=Dyella caseinilytica TaxID=1849581 RepID=A0ABX7GTJ9_9GAMM|nr:glycosyltransferase [Dyella caseinilytica]QRN53082.1 glycosyltransferase [Dyella caseinilytica]GGA11312.1 mannosyltransferase A [Dyella caseinilytica]